MKPESNLLVKLQKLNVHKCEKCPKVFPTANDLMKHMCYHDEYFLSHVSSAYVSVERARIFKCENCIQRFDNKRDFLLHRVVHVQANVRNKRVLVVNNDIAKPYKCPDCDISFAAQSTLDAHSILHLPFPHICKWCGIGFYQERDLKCHIKLVHRTEFKKNEDDLVVPQRKCEITPKRKLELNTPQTKAKSRNGKTSKKKLVKKENNENKKSKVKLKSEDTHSIEILKESSIPEPDIYIRKTTNNKYECPECKKLFTYKRYVIVHYRMHSGEKPYECHLCPKKFTQGITLQKHIERHVSTEKIYVCKYCPKAFAQPDYRDRHEVIHSDIKPFKCPFCGKAFHDQSAMTRHKRIHTGDKRYRCPYCPKAFCDVSALRGHKLRHEKKKLFKCDICDKRFYNQNDANKHTSTIHSQGKFFTCDYCKRSLISKFSLEMHMKRLHLKVEKPYQCQLCHKKYKHLNDLRRHLKKKHEGHNFEHLHTKVRRGKDECNKETLQKHIFCDKCLEYFESTIQFEEHKLIESEQCEICDEKLFCNNMNEKHLKVHFPDSYKQKNESDSLKEI